MSKYNNGKIVNLMRMVYAPMLIAIIFVLGWSAFSLHLNNDNLIDQYKEKGMILSNQISAQLSHSAEAQVYAESILEDKILTAAKAILAYEDMGVLSNELLGEMLEVLDVSELHYMDKDGKILYSTIEGYLGWEPHEAHPLNNFVRSEEIELLEQIREDDQYKRLIKYGALKSDSGTFVQVGIDAEIVEYAKEQFNYQSVIDSNVGNGDILGIYFYDLDKRLIACSKERVSEQMDHFEIGDFQTPDSVLVEKIQVKTSEMDIYKFYIPVFFEEELFGVLIIDFSLEAFEEFNRFIVGLNITMGICIIVVLLTFQYFNIMVPIQKLEDDIKQIDITNHFSYQLPERRNSVFLGLVNVINDILSKTYKFIFELNDTKEYIEHIAFHDELTDLPNRRGFVKLAEKEILAGKPGAIILIGLDNFKGINNTLGHLFGDKVLKSIAALLEEEIGNGNVSRFSGDEFGICITNFNHFSDIDKVLVKIMDQLKNNIVVEGKRVFMTTSIGISIFPNDSVDIYKLIMNADSAVYKVKEEGRNGYAYFDETMIQAINEKSRIEEVLRNAIDHGHFQMVYQPQVSLLSHKVVALEALIRLKSREFNPSTFIPVAEELGLIITIGRWVTRAVIEQVALWRDAGYELKPVAINFSPVQLRDKTFHQFLMDLLDQYDLPASSIELEVTENILIDNMEDALVYLNGFKDAGINLTLDDFGTGYSSINYLSSLPINKVKLDKSVIWKYIDEDKDDVIKTLIELTKCFNLKFVIEGVETEMMISRVVSCGGDIVQGYYHSRPVCAEDLYSVIKKLEED